MKSVMSKEIKIKSLKICFTVMRQKEERWSSKGSEIL